MALFLFSNINGRPSAHVAVSRILDGGISNAWGDHKMARLRIMLAFFNMADRRRKHRGRDFDWHRKTSFSSPILMGDLLHT